MLREELYYIDGELYYKKNKKKCGGSLTGSGYKQMCFHNTQMTVHRFIWIWHFGNYEGDLDHIDGDILNCKIENLRNCTRSQNLCNRRKFKESSSKYKGVYFRKDIKKWQASIKIDGKTKSLGVFTSEDAAAMARQTAAIELHGEFYRS